MNNKIEIEIENLDAVLRKVGSVENIGVDELLMQSGALVEARAKDILLNEGHTRTGELVRSIKYTDPENDEIVVFTNVGYAPYVEFGTGRFAENGNGRKGWWVYVDEECNAPKSTQKINYTHDEAKKVWARLAKIYGSDKVHITQGQLPTRFLRRALDDSEEDIKELFNNRLEELTKC